MSAGVPSKTVAHQRARIGSLCRSRAADDPELLAARRELATATIGEFIERTLASVPPLSREQRARIVEAVMRPAGAR